MIGLENLENEGFHITKNRRKGANRLRLLGFRLSLLTQRFFLRCLGRLALTTDRMVGSFSVIPQFSF